MLESRLAGVARVNGFRDLVLLLGEVVSMLIVNPTVLGLILKFLFLFCCVVGFCPRNLLHICPSAYTANMNERQLASLLYRDHLSLKHAGRERLHAEIMDARRKEDEGGHHSEFQVGGTEVEDVDPLLKALLDHLKEVGSMGLGSLSGSI